MASSATGLPEPSKPASFRPPPKQSEKLYDVGGAGSIGVGEYEHRGALIAATSFDQS